MECEDRTDEEIIQLVFTNSDYFLCLMRRYERRLLAYIRRLVYCSQEDAEDILQEVYIKAYANLAGFSAPLKFSAWIYRITHNQAISFLRRQARRPQVIRESKEEKQLVERLVDEVNLEEEVERKINQLAVQEVLARLDRKYREVLVLRYFEEKEYKEIADILRLPFGTVATLLSRAKQVFRKEITKVEHELGK